MKPIVFAIVQLLVGFCFASEAAFELNKDIVDPDLYRRAEVVIRVMVLSEGVGSQYWWPDVLNHATIKAPNGVAIPAKLQVACYSNGTGLPLGFATLYLVRYNPEHSEYGWKLLEDFDPISKAYKKGYSHHSADAVKR